MYQILLFRSTVSKNILNSYLHGKEQKEIFRTERFLDQSKKLSDTISKIAFSEPVDASKKSSTSNIPSNELNVKVVAEARKLMDIARSRGIQSQKFYNMIY